MICSAFNSYFYYSWFSTYLQDAHDEGAEFVVRCRAERILVDGGRAVGVEGTYLDPDGRRARVVVHAPQVAVACGSIESPALLLRSGIGGPAAGNYLRLHPATAMLGLHDGDQRSWWGPPQAGLVRKRKIPRPDLLERRRVVD